MSFDLYLWYEPGPITVDFAEAKVRRWAGGNVDVVAPHPAVSSTRDSLLERFPPLESLSDADIDELGVWSMTPVAADSMLVLSCRWSYADEVWGVVRTLAARAGLVCYESGDRILEPNAAGHLPRFTLTSMVLPTVPDPDAQHLERVARLLTAEKHFAVLERSDGFYVQVGYGRRAGVAPGTYALEYRAGPDGDHSRAETRAVAEAIRFLKEFRDGEDQWKQRHAWEILML